MARLVVQMHIKIILMVKHKNLQHFYVWSVIKSQFLFLKSHFLPCNLSIDYVSLV